MAIGHDDKDGQAGPFGFVHLREAFSRFIDGTPDGIQQRSHSPRVKLITRDGCDGDSAVQELVLGIKLHEVSTKHHLAHLPGP